MRYFFLHIFLLLITYVSKAQVIDSLEYLLQRNELGFEQRIDLKNELSREYTFVDPLRSINIATQVLEETKNKDYPKGNAYAYRNLASAYSYFGSFSLSINNLQKARTLFDDLHDSTGIANCMISLGYTYRRLHNREKELENNLQAYALFSRLAMAERIGITALNLAETYFLTNQLEKSLTLTKKAIHINDSLKNLNVLSACYKVMGLIFLEKNKLKESEKYFLKVLDITFQLGKNSQKLATVESMIALAKLYDKQGEKNKKIKILIQATEFVSANRVQDYVQEVYINLLDHYLEQSNVEKARTVINSFKETEEAINQTQLEDRNRLTIGFIKLFEIEKKNSDLAAKNRNQVERIHSRNQLIIASLISLLILLLFVLRLRNNIKKLKQTNVLLVEKDIIIARQNKKLEELNASKDKFFSVVSHDLKVPLNSIWNLTRILEENFNTLQKEQLMEMIKATREHVEVTTKMTENLLTWARLQMKEVTTTPMPVALTYLISEVCSLFKELAQTKQIELTWNIEEETLAWADKNQLDFIMRNLINNALKYTPVGGKVSLFGEKINEKQFRIKVIDSGKGIKQELIHKLFSSEPINSTKGTMGEQGAGLGLKLCYEFARLNNSSLLIMNKEGQGAEISLVIPVFSGQ